MSYLYDTVKEALGGGNFRSGTVSKHWSPNEVRAIILMRDFLLVADYLKNPKVIYFNQEELYRDLSNPNRRGNLNNLLEDRQLSCLEEIYVDEAFQQKLNGVIDLESYVKGLYNSRSRLRYYGYVTGMTPAQLERFYTTIFVEGNMDCTLAKNMGGFRYVDTGNVNWYCQYNLRDQFYELDKVGGRLHTYFSKCKQTIGRGIQDRELAEKELSERKKILYMFSCDVCFCNRIRLLMEYSKYMQGMESHRLKSIGEGIRKALTDKIAYKGLTKDRFLATVRDDGCPATPDAQQTATLYEKGGVFDDRSDEIEVGNEGFYQLGTRLSTALLYALKEARSVEDKVLWRLTVVSFLVLPECEFSRELPKYLNTQRVTVPMNSESIGLLIDLAYKAGGFEEKAFGQFIDGGVS